MKKKLSLLIAGLAVSLSACGYSVSSDQVAVQEGRGAEAKKVKGCKAPNDRAFWGNDFYAYYPTNERYWEAVGEGGDGPRFTVITKDSVEMLIPVTIQFNFKTDCDSIKEFYTKFGRRNSAYLDEDGKPEDTSQWNKMLKSLVATPADNTLDRIIQSYNWRDVWQDPATKVEIEKKLQESLIGSTSLMVQRAQGEYFEDISVLVGQPTPKNEDLATAVAAEQTAVAKAKSAEAQAAAEKAQAEAEVAVEQAKALKKEAEIAGYGSVENYLKYLCVSSGTGCNPWQPTYLYGGTPAKSP